jgi:hypothetical protein
MKKRDPNASRRFALILSGAIDCTFGAILLLAWTGLLPINLSALGISRSTAGLIGAVLFFPGLALLTYQLTRPAEPE